MPFIIIIIIIKSVISKQPLSNNIPNIRNVFLQTTAYKALYVNNWHALASTLHEKNNY